MFAGCGGLKSSPTNTTTNTPAPTPVSSPPAGTGGGPVNAPALVSVGPGQSVSGIDIGVPTPAGNPAPNAQVLGVAPTGAGGSAFNTGSVIHRGTTMKVLLFGPGLTGDAVVTIGGPN